MFKQIIFQFSPLYGFVNVACVITGSMESKVGGLTGYGVVLMGAGLGGLSKPMVTIA